MDQLTKCACKKTIGDITRDFILLTVASVLIIGAAIVIWWVIGWVTENLQIVVNAICGLLVVTVVALVAIYIAGKYRDAKIACGWKPEEDENFIDYMEK